MAKNKALRLSKAGGLNVTIPCCFWCGKSLNELALLGDSYKVKGKDAKAPSTMVLSYDPCQECQNNMSQGVVLIEAVTKGVLEQPAMTATGGLQVYPTGRWVVVSVDYASKALGLTTNKAFIDVEFMNSLLASKEGSQQGADDVN